MAAQAYYASDDLLAQYCEFHFGDECLGVENFPLKCVEILKAFFEPASTKRALDLGCAVGRSSFELSKYFEHVDALDYSKQFIETAESIRQNGSFSYRIINEGELFDEKAATLEGMDINASPANLSFHHGDAGSLDAGLSGYDLITAFNLLCRLPEPKSFLKNIHERLNPGGIFALATPCTWLEEFTPKDNWVGGYYDGDKQITTFDGVQSVLSENFELLKEPFELEFVIRETKRKYQHSFSEYSIWKKK